jgi:hypothetical protein
LYDALCLTVANLGFFAFEHVFYGSGESINVKAFDAHLQQLLTNAKA